MKACGKRWRKSYKLDSENGLKDKRTTNSGKSKSTVLTSDELIAKQKAEIEFLKAENKFFKKSEQLEGLVKSNKIAASKIFELINNIVNDPISNKKYNVKYLCHVAGVSKSGYYAYLKSFQSRKEREENDIKLRDVILKAFEYKGIQKGSRSIKMFLKNQYGIILNRKCIQRIMRKFKIICTIRKPNPYKRMAKATKEHSVVPNILQREFKQNAVAKVLLTDITYLYYGKNKLAYLSTIKDGSTNEILSYKVSEKMTIDIVTDTIDLLINNHKDIVHKDAFVHSDQGSQYTSPIFKNILKHYNLGQSMSRRGNCWDNAPQESFFGHMKDEMNYKNFSSFDELQVAIDDYMYYYNYERCQTGLNHLTPVDFRNQLIA